jgi:hypothetical protein
MIVVNNTIRAERSFEQYSRGSELVQAIKQMWEGHARLSYSRRDRNTIINSNIKKLMADFDLTLQEWYYWAKITLQDIKKLKSV